MGSSLLFDLDIEAPSIINSIQALDNRGIHNFSFHILDSYFNIRALVGKNGVKFHTPGILELSKLPGTNSTKVFVYHSTENDLPLLQKLQQQAVIYSIDDINLPKRNKFKELYYDLDVVFNPASYSNSKKRHQRITYPFSWLKKEGFEIQTDADFNAIKILHDTWVQKKLENPKTFKMMFPGKRYLRCVEQALSVPDIYACFIVKRCSTPVAVRVVGLQAPYAYDMAFFGNFWDLPSQSMNYINIWLLQLLHQSDIHIFNCGCFLNKYLHQYKAHYPHDELVSYSYSKL